MPDTDSLPPTQYLVMDVLAARARLGEQMWTFPSSLRPVLNALQERGLLWWKSGVVEKTCQAFLTDAGREMVLFERYEVPAICDFQDLLGNISLYIPWEFVTKQLTTEQKELFADAVDAWSARLNDGDPDWVSPMSRWWRDDA
jgi:hypothetical protein